MYTTPTQGSVGAFRIPLLNAMCDRLHWLLLANRCRLRARAELEALALMEHTRSPRWITVQVPDRIARIRHAPTRRQAICRLLVERQYIPRPAWVVNQSIFAARWAIEEWIDTGHFPTGQRTDDV